MYNPYLPQRETRSQSWEEAGTGGLFGAGADLLRRFIPSFEGTWKNAGMAGILKGIGLDDLDSGDILLLLIILLIFLEGDNTELVIALGIMLLLGGGDDQKE